MYSPRVYIRGAKKPLDVLGRYQGLFGKPAKRRLQSEVYYFYTHFPFRLFFYRIPG